MQHQKGDAKEVSAINSLTKRSSIKKGNIRCVTRSEIENFRDCTSKVSNAKVTCFGRRLFKLSIIVTT